MSLSELPPHVSLLPDEKVIMTLHRRYPSLLISTIYRFGIYFVVIGLYLASQQDIVYVLQQFGYSRILEQLIYLTLVAVALFFALVALVGYFYVQGHLYILTDRRIIISRKFITISIRETAYSEITDITLNQGPIARILNYGSVTPLSPGVRGSHARPYPFMRRFSITRLRLKDINQPSRIMNELLKLTRHVPRQHISPYG